jgi:hypothetical protein
VHERDHGQKSEEEEEEEGLKKQTWKKKMS